MTDGFPGLVLIAAKAATAVAAEDWAAWLPDHVASLAGGPVLESSGWALADPATPGRPGLGHSHLIRLDLAETGPTTTRDIDDRLRDLYDAGEVHPAHTEIRRDLWIGHRQPTVLDPAVDPSAVIAAEVLCTHPDQESDWDTWYDEQHLPDMLGSGAFVRGSRWRREPTRLGGANHLTLYEIAGIDLTEAVERSAAIMPDLITAGRKHRFHAGGLTMAARRVC